MNQIDLSTFWNSLPGPTSVGRALKQCGGILADRKLLVDKAIKEPLAHSIIAACCTLPSLRRSFAAAGVTPARFGERAVAIPFPDRRDKLVITGAGTNHLSFQLFWRGMNYYEPFTRTVLEGLTSSRDVFIDVGANAGFFSLVTAKLNPRLRAVAFEPNPRMFELLSKNKQLNALSNLTVEQVALSNREGEGRLFLNGSDMSASLTPEFQSSFNPVTGSVPVKTMTLDKYVEEHAVEGSLVLKVDVEGHEREFLDGAERTLEMRKPDMILEVLENFDAAMIARFKSLGYRFYKITHRGLLKSEKVQLTRIGDFTFFNYLFTTRAEGEMYRISAKMRERALGINLYNTSKYVTHPVGSGSGEAHPLDEEFPLAA
jgi:FkbM family methyltransferase